MNFELTESQQQLYDSVLKFARQELATGAVERAHAADYPWDVVRQFAELGLLGITVAEADGGVGGSLVDAILAIQAVAAVCPRSADVVQAGNFGALRTFAEYASAEQKARFLPGLLAGRILMSVSMSEPGAGSAVTELQTRAVLDGDDVIINGSKIFGTNSSEAGVFLVYVRFGPGVAGIGSILVEKGSPGFEIGKASTFMNGEQWAPLYFDDCRIPAANILLGAGGFKRQIAGFNVERLGNAARSVALGRHAFDVACEHAKTRHQFGRPLCEFQGIQWKFAEMALKLESAQLLLMRAAHRADAASSANTGADSGPGLPSAQDAALAKLACNEAGFFAANESLQVLGALGFSDDSIVSYCVRRTRGWMIAGGSVEMLKNRIAEGVFERRFAQRTQ